MHMFAMFHAHSMHMPHVAGYSLLAKRSYTHGSHSYIIMLPITLHCTIRETYLLWKEQISP